MVLLVNEMWSQQSSEQPGPSSPAGPEQEFSEGDEAYGDDYDVEEAP